MGSSEENNNLSSHKLNGDLVELDLEQSEPENLSQRSRQTTDLVGLFLEEMGRIPLLERDEEISEAQKVQRHLKILEQREQAAKQGNTTLAELVKIIKEKSKIIILKETKDSGNESRKTRKSWFKARRSHPQ